MQSIIETLSGIFGEAFEAQDLPAELGRVIRSDRPDLGQFQCNGALAAAKQHKKNPREVATKIVEHLQGNDMFQSLELAGPGFINIKLTDAYLADVVKAAEQVEKVTKPRKVFIDYGGANAAKPLHVGHLRAAIVGEAIKRLYRLMGDDVIGDVHWGDWGTHIGMIISEIKRRGLDYKKVTADDLAEIYPAASGRCKGNEDDMKEASAITAQLQAGDQELREMWMQLMAISRVTQEKTYGDLGVNFEQWFGESRYQERIPTMIERLKKTGVVEESKGALIIRVKNEDDKQEIPPLILTKTDGGFLYGTTDMATVEERVDDFAADLIMYVVDYRQGLHFEQVFRACRLGGILPDNVDVDFLGYGTVNGSDGKPYKTRAGGTPQLNDLMALAVEKAAERVAEAGIGESDDERAVIANQVGQAAIKFGDLSNDLHSSYVFDIEKFSQFEGKTGPYLQYAAVRIQSLLAKAKAEGFSAGEILAPTQDAERDLILQLLGFQDALQVAYDRRAPHMVADFAYQLASSFSRFYNACHIMTEGDKARQSSWLALSDKVLQQLKIALEILMIDIPARM